jgi:glycolate oxidase FAD binding subunit
VRDHQHPFFAAARSGGQPLWRLSVKPTAPYTDLGGEQLIEWGGALRWLAGSEGTNVAKLRAWAAAQGGHATLFRGRLPDVPVFHPLEATMGALHRRLKAVFDPHGILNPKRMLADA